jgi:hypothetical protein
MNTTIPGPGTFANGFFGVQNILSIHSLENPYFFTIVFRLCLETSVRKAFGVAKNLMHSNKSEARE